MHRCFLRVLSVLTTSLIALGLSPYNAPADTVILEPNETALRTAVEAGGVIKLGFDGQLVLGSALAVNGPVTIDASGHEVTFSGGGTTRLFNVAKLGSLTLTNLVLVNGSATNGGAIYNEGTLKAVSCTFRSNSATDALLVERADVGGGAVYSSGSANLELCRFIGNKATGRMGATSTPRGGLGAGGALFSSGELVISGCSFAANVCAGGRGIANMGPLSDDLRYGGPAMGGALLTTGSARVLASTFTGNEAHGGQAGNSAIYDTGNGGRGMGGAIANFGNLCCTNVTLYGNIAAGGAAGYSPYGSGPGEAVGGAIYAGSNTTVLDFCTVFSNKAVGGFDYGDPARDAFGGGLLCETGAVAQLHSSIVASNIAAGNFAGPIADLGYNISSDRSGAFTSRYSHQDTNPELGPLLDNGGPTLTMLPLPTSPAIGGGAPAFNPTLDQRGIRRPQYGSNDAGATEFVGTWPRVLRLSSGAYAAVEGDTLLITVACAGNPEGEVTVQCFTRDGTALAGSDYVSTNLVLSFQPGETTKSFQVRLLSDATIEDTETMAILLTNVTGPAVLDNPSNSVVAIADAEFPHSVCTVDDLLAQAAQGSEITFGCSGTYVLNSPLVVTNELTIDGRSHQIVLSGSGGCRLFEVRSGGSLTLRNLTLANGTALNGGAIYNEGTLNAVSCTFRSNAAMLYVAAPGGGAVYNAGDAHFDVCQFIGNSITALSSAGRSAGGAIFSSGELDVSECYFSSNSCSGGAATGTFGYGGTGVGGALFTTGRARVTASTFTDNAAFGGQTQDSGGSLGQQAGAGMGGAVGNFGALACTNLTLHGNIVAGGTGYSRDGAALGGAIYAGSNTTIVDFCTIVSNRAVSGPGHEYEDGSALAAGVFCSTSAVVQLHSSIVASNNAGGNFAGPISDLGYNISSDRSGAFTSPYSLQDTDPELGPLQDNGGPTLTMLPLPASPAMGGGDTTFFPSLDQRGVPRPQHGSSDAGATEFDAPWPRVLGLSSSRYRAVEGNTVSITVTCSGNPEGVTTVKCFTVDGTGLAGSDYVSTNLVLSFQPGEKTKSFQVQLLSDATVEEIETFSTVLSDVTGPAVLANVSNSIVLIADTEFPHSVCSVDELIAQAGQGGAITFGCSGTYLLERPLVVTNDVTIDGRSHQVLLSGNHRSRLFEVTPSGSLTLRNLTLADGIATNGGAIYNEGTLKAVSCTFRSNSAADALLVEHADVGGGAVYSSGSANLELCRFIGNTALASGITWWPAQGAGGAIYSSGELDVTGCTFASNSCAGGTGFDYLPAGMGVGGALFTTGNARALASTFSDNEAHGGRTRDATVTVTSAHSGGAGMGGAIGNLGNLTCTNLTLYRNVAAGGAAGSSRGGAPGSDALGGAIYAGSNTTCLDFCTIIANQAVDGPGYPVGLFPAGKPFAGVFCATGAVVQLHGSIVASNIAGGNFAGPISDLGYNISSDLSGAFTSARSLQATDPELGPLQDNGGPTLTMLPLPTSPTIGGGDTASSPTLDQRGLQRPQYGSSDAGATEFVGTWPRVLRFSSSRYSGVEDNTVLITVTCGGNPEGEVTVQCLTADGTALAGSDYVSTNVVLSFASGETTRSFQVRLLSDATMEETETFSAVLTNVTGPAVVADPSNSVFAIADAEFPHGIGSVDELLAQAAAGGEITFGSSGTYVLNSPLVVTNELTIDGRSHQILLSGNDVSRLFEVRPGGLLTLRNLTLTNGRATNGGAIYNDGGEVRVEQCTFTKNLAWGNNARHPQASRAAEPGRGGAICNAAGFIRIDRSSFVENAVIGGYGYYFYLAGKEGAGGALYNGDTMSIVDCAFIANRASGGNGTTAGGDFHPGGDGLGGAMHNNGIVALTNVTFSANQISAGYNDGPISRKANAFGGAFYQQAGTATLEYVTFAKNFVVPGSAEVGKGDNLAVKAGSVYVGNSIIASARGATNCDGALIDLGYNISNDSSCAFTNSTSRNGIDPLLGEYGDHGGPTYTIALLPESPAIDAGALLPGIATDQRGIARPFGSAPDIGAFEWQRPSDHVILTSRITAAGQIILRGWGPANKSLRLATSTDLGNWSVLTNLTTDSNGYFEQTQPASPTASNRFYRVTLP